MRVLQLGSLYNNHLRRWSAHAQALGCTVYAAGHVKPGRRPADLSGVTEAVAVAPEDLYGRGAAPHVAWLRSVLRRFQPDLVQAHWLPKWAYFATLTAQPPLVVTAWGSDVYETTGIQGRRVDWTLRNADRVIARSRHMRRAMLDRGAPDARIHLADLGVDLERFSPATVDEKTRIRRELGLSGGPVVVSFRAGTALYNLDVVLDAFRILRERLRDATLLVVNGDAPLAESVQARLRETGAVRLVGHVPHADMPRYLRAATVGVSIPSSDGSPSSVWEALASGVPVVLSDLPQVEEKVGRSGAVALVEPRAEEVAAALVDIASDPERRRRMAYAARAWAVANMDEREQVARLAGVYAATARRPVPAPAPSRAPAPDRRSGLDTATAAAPRRRPS